MGRGGIALALVVTVLAALLITSAFRQVAQQIERHVPARPQHNETADRKSAGGRATAIGGFIKHGFRPRSLVSQVPEGLV